MNNIHAFIMNTESIIFFVVCSWFDVCQSTNETRREGKITLYNVSGGDIHYA